ncbi:hypothetical protein [Spirosoma rhododendri]|uniref:Uncharacterized protein n=1 Tax=Spirosoma rhododendri TaxID=2728024 RepID=A0A7L5DLJ6_9BACT|nr:hypothetical protein [Spirosoma rhododendri]QJD79354.1 hypothetical protein HH216_13715 [Spirosoma rhododendri]
MKKETQKTGSERIIRRYSDHPIIQKKLAEANKFLETADLSFLDNPPRKKDS